MHLDRLVHLIDSLVHSVTPLLACNFAHFAALHIWVCVQPSGTKLRQVQTVVQTALHIVCRTFFTNDVCDFNSFASVYYTIYTRHHLGVTAAIMLPDASTSIEFDLT